MRPVCVSVPVLQRIICNEKSSANLHFGVFCTESEVTMKLCTSITATGEIDAGDVRTL